MSGFFAFMFLVLATAAGGGTAIYANRLIAMEHRRTHQEVGSIVFLQLGVVFAVLLAFVFDETWSQYNQAAQSVDLETGALHGAAMIASTLPPDERRTLLDDEIAYVASIVGPEWRIMRTHRREDVATDDLLVTLVRDAAIVARDAHGEGAGPGEILALLAAAHSEREQRIYQVRSGVPGALWLVLIVFAVVLVGFVALAGLAWRLVTVTFTAMFAAAITSILVIARLLDYPFEGALAISPSDFTDLLGKLRLLLAGA